MTSQIVLGVVFVNYYSLDLPDILAHLRDLPYSRTAPLSLVGFSGILHVTHQKFSFQFRGPKGCHDMYKTNVPFTPTKSTNPGIYTPGRTRYIPGNSLRPFWDG